MNQMLKLFVAGMLCVGVASAAPDAAKVRENKLRLPTRWAKDVTATHVHPEYPRPTMVRSVWMSLNGIWDCTIRPFSGPVAGVYQGTVLVPFPVESGLSGVQRMISERDEITYQRNFTVPKAWAGKRVLLHFEAVDWEAKVLLNGQPLGVHQGGYDRFSFDLTDKLVADKEQQLTVVVRDPGDKGTQPRGKQTLRPSGIYYTGCSGIWQSVWLEPVTDVSIAALRIVPDLDSGSVQVEASLRGGGEGLTVEAVAMAGGQEAGRVSAAVGTPLNLKLSTVNAWSPEQPYLYDLKVALKRDGKVVDEVGSYFGLRKVSIVKDERGHPRIALNGRPYFQMGPLDQGYWPDGIYTAPTDAALKSDIELMKQLGFNVCRKHVKVEPERWYYWCDKLGLLVWQDMPNGGRNPVGHAKESKPDAETARQFELELQRLITGRFNHPSITLWIPFNEGWGQYDTERIAKQVKAWDRTRLVICPSGWNDLGAGDVWSQHTYSHSMKFDFEGGRAIVCGEGAGFGLPVRDHLWTAGKTWSYASFNQREELEGQLFGWFSLCKRQVSDGLSGAIFTQLTDVETEVNGLVTYDREVLKIEAKHMSPPSGAETAAPAKPTPTP